MVQIGDTFTRLQPAIEFADSAFTPQEGTVSVLGDPPAKFAEVHSPSFLNAWYNKLQDCLERPVRTEQRGGQRRVIVLGTAIYDFASDGSLKVSGWNFDEECEIVLVELPATTVVLQVMPLEILWLEWYMLGAVQALAKRAVGSVDLRDGYVDWAQGQLLKSCWDKKTQDRVSKLVAAGLDLDLLTVSIANQVQQATLNQLPLRVGAYNDAIRHRVGYQQVLTEAPQFLTLYALLADQLNHFHPEVKVATEQLQNHFKFLGFKPATWRMFWHGGTEWMKEFFAFYKLDRQEPCRVGIDLLDLVMAFGAERLPPMWLLRGLIQLGGTPNQPKMSYANRLRDLYPLCARLGHLAAQAAAKEDQATLDLMEDRTQDIFSWASTEFEKQSAGYARQATLRGILRKIDAHNLHEEMRLKGEKPWNMLYGVKLKDADVQAVILDSPLAVWKEGRDMRHCADNYIERCGQGDLVMVSLRRTDGHHALATVAFDVSGEDVTQKVISGFANALVTPEVHLMAKECMAQLQKQHPLVQMALAA